MYELSQDKYMPSLRASAPVRRMVESANGVSRASRSSCDSANFESLTPALYMSNNTITQ